MYQTHLDTNIKRHFLSHTVKPTAQIHSVGGSFCFSLSIVLGLCLPAPTSHCRNGICGLTSNQGGLREKPTKPHHKVTYEALSHKVPMVQETAISAASVTQTKARRQLDYFIYWCLMAHTVLFPPATRLCSPVCRQRLTCTPGLEQQPPTTCKTGHIFAQTPGFSAEAGMRQTVSFSSCFSGSIS